MLEKLFRKRSERKEAERNPYLIRGCIGTHEMPPADYFVALDAVGVQWIEDPKEQKKKGQKNSGKLYDYVISAADEQSKRSDAYGPCLGVVVSGRSKKNGKDISFLLHHSSLLDPKVRKKFERDLRLSISNLMKLSKKGTVDAVIFGGDFSGIRREDYSSKVQFLNKILQEGTGVSPHVISGPSLDGDSGIDAFFDTENRKLHITQHDEDARFAAGSFPASEVKNESKKWKAK